MGSKHTGQRAAAVASVVLFAACADPSGPSSPAAGSPQLARSAQAQARLEAIFQRATPEVMGLPGAVFIDNDEAAGKVVVGIERGSGAAGQVRAAMARLGVDAADFAVEETAPIVQMATLRDRFEPTVAGIQIHFGQYVCTMGANVLDGTERSFITNSHCTNTQGGVEGTVYYQPASSVDGTAIATEVEDPTYFKGGVCPRGKKCRYSDASRARYAERSSTQGGLAYTTGANTGSLTVAGTRYFTSQDNTTSNFQVGTVVNKVGRTTGWTRGQVTRSCVNTAVQGSQVLQL
jgi:hypothetical protein